MVWGIVIYLSPSRYTFDIIIGLVDMTFCTLIPSTISGKLKVSVLLGGLVAVIFQSLMHSILFFRPKIVRIVLFWVVLFMGGGG